MKKYKFIAIGTIKGGVGKSTLCVNMAMQLAKEGKKVLVIDVDPQSNSSMYLNADVDNPNFKGLFNALQDKSIAPEEVVIKTQRENLDLLASTLYLSALERDFSNISFAELQLKRYIDKYLDFFNKYDYIIADTNPSMSKLNQNAFVLADKIISVTDIGVGSLRGITLFHTFINNLADNAALPLKIDALVINDCAKNTNVTKEFLDYVNNADFTKDIVLENQISTSIKWKDAEVDGKCITDYKKGKPAKEFLAVMQELKSREVL